MEQSETVRRTLFEPEVRPAEPVEAKPVVVVDAVPTLVEVPVEEDDVDELPPRRFNPWLAVLWVLGLALAVAGFAVNWMLARQSSNSDPILDNEVYWAVVSVAQNFAPWFLGVGLAAIVCAVLIHALDWRERHS